MSHVLINEIASKNSEDGHLSRLDVSDEQWKRLTDSIRQYLDQQWSGVPSYDKLGWGAAVMLAGTRVFRELPEGPFTWDKIGARIGVSELSDEIGPTEYKLIDEGSENYWDIQILKNEHGHRRFIGTMLLYSGGGWAIVQSLAERVSTLWNWKGLVRASRGEIAEWLEQIRRDYRYLPASTRRVLESDDGRIGMAERLAEVARGREKILNQGGLTESPQQTAESLRTEGISVSALLGAPAERSDQQLLGDVFDFSSDQKQRSVELSEPQWRWVEDSGSRAHLVISLPETIRNVAINNDIAKMKVRIPNSEQGRWPTYRRKSNEVFEHFRGPSILALSERPSFPIQLVIEPRTAGDTTEEIPWNSVEFPDKPVGVFNRQNGECVDEAEAGTELVFVAPEQSLLNASVPLQELECDGIEAWGVELPEEGLDFELIRSDTEELVERHLAPKSSTLSLRVAGSRIDNVTFGNAPAYEGWPEILVGSSLGDARYELLSGNESQEGRCVVRGGRLVLKGLNRKPGRYTLRVFDGNRRSEVRFAALPRGSRFDVQHSPEGTKLKVQGVDVELSAPEASETVALNSLRFSGDIRKTLSVSVNGQGETPSLSRGRWRVTAAGYHAEIVTARDGEVVESPRDLGLLRGSGGLRIFGPPGDSVRVETGEYRWLLSFDSRGERFFPFVKLPEAALEFDRQPFELDVKWDGDSQSFGPFIDQRLVVPEVDAWQVMGQEVYKVRAGLQWDVGGELKMELLPAWSPWEKTRRRAAERNQRDREGKTFVAEFRVSPGPYKVRLTRNGQPVSGVADVVFPDAGDQQLHPDKQLDPDEKYLWYLHTGTRKFRPNEALKAFDDCPPVVRNRRRSQWLRRLEDWPPRWFESRKLLPEIASEENLRAMLGFPVPHLSEKKVPKAFEHLPDLAVRYADLDRIFELVSRQKPDDQADVFLHLVDREIGLTVPAFQAWRDGLADKAVDRIVSELPRWSAARSSEITKLTREEKDELRVLDSEHPADDGLRFCGLYQARRHESALKADTPLDEAVRNVESYSRRHDLELPRTVKKAVQHKTFRRTTRIEAAVASICYELDKWRAGMHPGPIPWDTLEKLAGCVPRLLDYWLNQYAHGISVPSEVV